MIHKTARTPDDNILMFEFTNGAEHIAKYMGGKNWYELEMLQDIRERLLGKSPGLAVDVGAFCGTHTAWFDVACKQQVVAFEPSSDSFRALEKNIYHNNLHAQPYNIALGEAPSRASVLRTNIRNTGTDKLVLGEGDLEVRTLDSFDFNDVRLIKIDVEGMEVAVLRGALETIRKWHPLLYVEAPETYPFVTAMLVQEGYTNFGKFNATPTYGYSWTDH